MIKKYVISKYINIAPFEYEEVSAYAKIIVQCLNKDEDCAKYLPIDPNTNDVFSKLVDGVLLCKLINCAEQGTIAENVINKNVDKKDTYKIMENLKLAISSSVSIGCQLKGVDPSTFLDKKYESILDILWQILKVIIY
jgi:vacuolar-type H+-ATPase subunit E/Vma4